MNPVLLVVLFGAGVASSLAPCVLPLVPAYVGMVAGGLGRDRTRSPLAGTCAFVLGLSVVFVGLGMMAGLAGATLDTAQVWTQRVGGVVVALSGLAMLTGMPNRLAATWRPLAPHVRRVPVLVGPFVVGVAFGAAWTPCVGPLLGAALVLAADRASAIEGATLLFAYALGVGAPFVAGSLVLASAPRATDRLRRVSKPIHKAAGLLLIGLGALLSLGLYPHLTSFLAQLNPLSA